MRTLLEDINLSIKNAGGKNRLANFIIQETPKWFDIETQRFFKRRASQANSYCKVRHRKNGWSEDDLAYLLKNYGTMPVSRLARILDRNPKAVAMMFYKVATIEQRLKLPKLKTGQKFRKYEPTPQTKNHPLHNPKTLIEKV